MKKILFSSLALAFFLPQAQAQFFGGYPDGVSSVPTHYNNINNTLKMVYDDFTFDLPGDIFQFQMYGRNNTGSPVGMYVEIRSGMSEGDGGTLVYSGINFFALFGALPGDGSMGVPPPGSGEFDWFYSSTAYPGIHLEAGTYWLGLAAFEGFGSFDVGTTQGLGSIGHPINDGNAFYYDNSNPSANFVSMGDLDFSLYLNTYQNTIVNEPTSTVPEPNSLLWLSVGLLGFIRRIRKAS